MSDTPDTPTPPPSDIPPPTSPARVRSPLGVVILAWSAILGLIVFMIFGRQAATEGDGPATNLNEVTFRIESQLKVVAVELQPEKSETGQPLRASNRAAIDKTLDSSNTGGVDERFRVVTMHGEMGGPDAALKALDELETDDDLTPDEESVAEVLRRLYEGVELQRRGPLGEAEAPATPILSPEDQQLLHEYLGWFGDLAASADQYGDPAVRQSVLRPAQWTFFSIIGILLWFLVLGFAGLVGLSVFLVGLLVRGVKLRVAKGGGNGVYAETFALWMALFIGMSWLVGRYAPEQFKFLVYAAMFFVSLLALVWPVARGVSWRQVRIDIGWTPGPAGALEPAMGVVAYAMTLPWLVPALVVTMALMVALKVMPGLGMLAVADASGSSNLPAHPVVFELAKSDWSTRLQILLVAVVAAPVVEETMFRGVLYRHLREMSARWGRFWSVLLSALTVSFLFAVIHPQGPLGVPVLMALSFGFCLAREWRASLVSCMVAHGITNGVSLTMVMLLFGS